LLLPLCLRQQQPFMLLFDATAFRCRAAAAGAARHDGGRLLLYNPPALWTSKAAKEPYVSYMFLCRTAAAGAVRHDGGGHAAVQPAGCDTVAIGNTPYLLFVTFKFVWSTGQPLLERYGMTEAGMLLSNSLAGERRPGCVGTPLPGVEARLAPAGADAEADGDGGDSGAGGGGEGSATDGSSGSGGNSSEGVCALLDTQTKFDRSSWFSTASASSKSLPDSHRRFFLHLLPPCITN